VNKSLLNDSIAGSTIEGAGVRDVNRSFAAPLSSKNNLSNTDINRQGAGLKNPRTTRMSLNK